METRQDGGDDGARIDIETTREVGGRPVKTDHVASETTTPAPSKALPAASSPEAQKLIQNDPSDYLVTMTVRISVGTVKEVKRAVTDRQLAAVGRSRERATIQDFVEKSLRLGLKNPALLETL